MAGATIVVLMFGLAFAVAAAQDRVLSELRSRAAQIKRWGGVLLILVGAWMILLSLFSDFFASIFPV